MTLVQVDLEVEAAASTERVADLIETELHWLESLGRQAGIAADDSEEFTNYFMRIKDSLRALRGLD